jgi:hypothetical protein
MDLPHRFLIGLPQQVRQREGFSIERLLDDDHDVHVLEENHGIAAPSERMHLLVFTDRLCNGNGTSSYYSTVLFISRASFRG